MNEQIKQVYEKINDLIVDYEKHHDELEHKYPDEKYMNDVRVMTEKCYWNGQIHCLCYLKNFVESIADEISVNDIQNFINKRMNELWEIIPDYDTVINEKHTKMDSRNLGVYIGYEEVADFIEKSKNKK